MEPKPTYFDKESPDFNMGLWGKLERLAANRVVVCLMTEFGLCNDARMQIHQVSTLIESIQTTTGTFKERRPRVKLKNSYIKQRHLTRPIRTTIPTTLEEHYGEGSSVDSIS